ncbi:MAG: DUF6504 family protein [Anaerolineales bacterium]|jgi:hypothetical protein
MESKLRLKRFISEPISVIFLTPPSHIKSPPCPDQFIWGDQTFIITVCLSEGKDFSRRGRMAKNMQPQHARVASLRGSWGVGRFFFDVQTSEDEYYRIYYDRAPKDATDRQGHWVLLAELTKD